MLKRLKIRLYPNKKQKEVLNNHFNAYRFLYNLSLEYKIMMYKDYGINKSGYDLSGEILELRKEVGWLSKCKAECLREAGTDVDKTFKKFFKGSGYPKFKSKRSEDRFTALQAINCKDNILTFFKQKIKFKTSEKYKNLLNSHKIKQVTFKKDKCGDYWASCLIDTTDTKQLPKTDNTVGIDLGIKHLVITSDGEFFENKRYFDNTRKKLKRAQQKFSRTEKGSKNREKQAIKVAKIYRKISRQREHYYHQITNKLLNENQVIVMEDLKIQNMLEKRELSRLIADASWGLLTTMLEYKANWYGREIIKIDTYFPSSKMCSSCGNIKQDLKLSDRVYKCNNCDLEIDRDYNATLNIKNSGIKLPLEPVESEVTNSMNQEFYYKNKNIC